MTRESLPPQAYTKETLANAITWLQTQPEHVKALVRTQDALVTLYLKWKRNGATALDSLSPSSHERLREDLKSIRHVMDQFEPDSRRESTTASQNSNGKTRIPAPSTMEGATDFEGPPETAPLAYPQLKNEPANASRLAPDFTPDAVSDWDLDVETIRKIKNVRHSLNLSDDSEVIRLLVSLGYDKIRDQLPRP